MQLNDLKPAWQQLKLKKALEPIDTKEILSLIEQPENIKRTGFTRALVNIVMFIGLIIFCQGG